MVPPPRVVVYFRHRQTTFVLPLSLDAENCCPGFTVLLLVLEVFHSGIADFGVVHHF